MIKHSDDEWVRVQAMAKMQGISAARLYTRALWTGDAVAAATLSSVYAELTGLRRGLGGGLTNLNQIAHAANISGAFEVAELQATRELLQRNLDRVNDVLSRLPDDEASS